MEFSPRKPGDESRLTRSALGISSRSSVISAHDYNEIAHANREKSTLDAEVKAKMLATATLRAEVEKLRNWSRHAVPFWLAGPHSSGKLSILDIVAKSLRQCMKAGRDLSGHASHRDAGESGELTLRENSGGVLIRYARVGPQSVFVDSTHFPGIPEEAFTWNYRALRDFEEFSYCLPGAPVQTVERRSAFSFLDLAAASAGLGSVSEHWAEAFPGFSFELGKYNEEGGVPHVAYYIRVYIPTSQPGGGAAFTASAVGNSTVRPR